MNLKLLLLGLTLCVNLNNAAFSVEKINFDSLSKWTEVGIKAAELSNDNDLRAASALLSALGHAIPYAGPLAILMSGILGMGVESELSQVMDKLQNMNNKLDKLDNRFDEVLKKIESVQIIAAYKSKIEVVNNLKHTYERFTSNPTNKTRDDFKAECGSNKMMMFARWIESEVNAETHLPLQQVMIEGYDMRNFNYWSNQITALLTNALFLHSTCLGVSGYNETIITETLNGTNGSKGDIEIFKKVLENVKKGFNQGVKFIKRSFYRHAKQEVENFLGEEQNAINPYTFTHGLYHYLTKKYFWRLWGVASWSDESWIDDHMILHDYAFTKNAWMWHRFEKNLIVGSVLPDKSNKTYKKIEDSFERCRMATKYQSAFFHDSKALNVLSILNFCLGFSNTLPSNQSISSLAIILGHIGVGKGSNFAGFHQRGIYNPKSFDKSSFFCNLNNVANVDVHVFVVPYDFSDGITEGEVCSTIGFSCPKDEHCCSKSEETDEFFCCPDTTSCAENGCE